METKKRIRLILAALLGLSRVLPAAADASDWLPLAVGNSWTYSHLYHDLENTQIESQWTNFREPLGRIPRFTLSVLGIEVIDGHTYFVVSNMPESWPPVPRQFIAGKKLRWEGTHLMERTADGERSVFRFDGTNDAGYAIETDEGDNLVKARAYSYPVSPVDFYQFTFHGTERGFRGCAFVENYGCIGCAWGMAWEAHRIFDNDVLLLQAVLGGRTVEYENLLTPTSIPSSSWGQVKKEVQ